MLQERPTFAIALFLLLPAATPVGAGEPLDAESAPRIVNIVNFIRLLEPRSEEITEERLFRTVQRQAELMQQHNLPGTFLLQYDALMDPRYQEFLKSLPTEQFEIGGWWELPQPLVEKAGLPWRGRYAWDWHANVGFASGYTPAEREKLVDVYMADFHSIFGDYPKSVASWFIDAHTLRYMHEKYGVVASANCKDQVGTDGYTLWGGYWNQAYYPSKRNAYMPAQTEDGQIPVPIFRMLGSDPLRQYDTGVGSGAQGVISLEPVYGDSGGGRQWVDWYMKNLVEGECLAFNYAQAGQENSFTWRSMRRGLQYQFPLIAQLRDKGELRVETLASSGEWFRQKFATTPATSMAYLSPLDNDNRQTVWFNSRFYRANLIWEDEHLRVRDIHLFDESVASPILADKVDKPAVEFFTLPVVDGFRWSSRETRAGLIFKAEVDGKVVVLSGRSPRVFKSMPDTLSIEWPLTNVDGRLSIVLDEKSMSVSTDRTELRWWLELETADRNGLPLKRITQTALSYEFQGTSYQVGLGQGAIEEEDKRLCIWPSRQGVTLNLATGR
ncbi:hypothetical protein [Aeoliella sp.]|uniref:hypothetical protein n=1 Tax=Aeoliella sp. TaxID=2795800 RepID=UPI003CCBEC25